jgi:hypothetical protein
MRALVLSAWRHANMRERDYNLVFERVRDAERRGA